MIRLRLLGLVELEGSDGVQARAVLAQPKRLMLLAYLSLSPGVFHRRDILLAMFWPELDASRARGALNQAVRFLRRELGGAIIVSRGTEEIGIPRDGIWCDAYALLADVGAGRHRDALDLYRGDLLAGFHVDGCAAFDDWAERERARVRTMAAKAARLVAEAGEVDGNYTTAIATARRAVDLSAGDERVVRELLLMLDRMGDRAGALHAYDEFARRLDESLGALPSPETVDVVRRIRSRAPSPAEYTPPARFEPGVTVDGRQIVRELGRGGMSTVFLAKDVKHDRYVALKTLRPELAKQGVERFLREVQITARLAHPHVLPLIDSGASDGVLYLVTPFVSGETLRTRVGHEPRLTIDEAVHIGTEIAEALDYAHRLGVIHRDVKPENVLLADGHAVVADFGVARALATSGASTIPDSDPGAVVGSRAYMSPEQVAGSDDVSPQADLYSLGCVIHEMLIAALPAAGTTASEIMRRRPGISPALAQLVASCVATRVADRPKNAADVVRALQSVLREPATASTRRPFVWIAAAAAVLIATIALAYGAKAVRDNHLAVLDTRLIVGSTELEIDPAISPDGARVAYAIGPLGAMRIAVRSVDGGPATIISASLGGTHRSPKWSPDGSQILFVAWGKGTENGAYVVPAAGGVPRLIAAPSRVETSEAEFDPVNGRGVITAAWSPDGKRIGFSEIERIVIRSLDGGALLTVATGRHLHSPSFSPDGGHIAYVAGNAWGPIIFNMAVSAVCIAAVRENAPSTCITDTTHFNVSPVWSPDGKSVLFVSNASSEGDVYEQRLTSSMQPDGAATRLTTGLAAFEVSFSADGRRAVYSVVHLRSRVWAAPIGPRPADASSLIPITNEAEAIEGVDVSRDGQWLAYDSNRSGNSGIFKVSTSGGEPIRLTHDSAPDMVPRWSPDGRSIAYYSMRGGTRHVRLMSADGSGDRPLTNGPLEYGYSSWSPSGNEMAVATDWGAPARISILSRSSSDAAWSPPRPLELTNGELGGPPAWSPDGEWIVYVRADRMPHDLYIIPRSGGTPRRLADGVVAGESLQTAMWGSDPRTIFIRSGHAGAISFWAVPVETSGSAPRLGRPRLLLRLDRQRYPSRRQEFSTDGRRLYFTLTDDAADVWMMNLKR